MTIRDDALDFATIAHANMRDKVGLPYIDHCLAVACHAEAHAERAGLHPTLVGYVFAIGMLHDVVEDTPTPLRELEARFPFAVVRGVLAMTHLRDEPYELDYLARVAHDPLAPYDKIADQDHNAKPERMAAWAAIEPEAAARYAAKIPSRHLALRHRLMEADRREVMATYALTV